MAERRTLLIVSDIHYAGPLEKTRVGYEYQAIDNLFTRLLVRGWRKFIWLDDPFGHTNLIDRVLNPPREPHLVIANGDYSCDSAFIGVSDPASLQSASICLGKLRERFAPNFLATFGDHELGKLSLCGGKGGIRLASFIAAIEQLKLEPFWTYELGNYVLLGVTSSLICFPIFIPEAVEAEVPAWNKLREEHMEKIRQVFLSPKPSQKILLFCHDPTALPYLLDDDVVNSRLHLLEETVIGHLHSPLILWKSKLFAGLPPISALGKVILRLTMALNRAKKWKPFKVRLCPSLAGIQIRRAGGFYLADIDPTAQQPIQWTLCRTPWKLKPEKQFRPPSTAHQTP